jgi:hypothetical protein
MEVASIIFNPFYLWRKFLQYVLRNTFRGTSRCAWYQVYTINAITLSADKTVFSGAFA